MSQAKKILQNRRGEATYIYLCVLIVVFSVLFSALVLYMGLIAQVEMQKRDVQVKLDDYVSSYAIDGFDALKQGTAYESSVDWDGFEAGSYAALGFPTAAHEEYVYAGNRRMTRPTTTVLRGNGLGITVTYIAKFPITWNGHTITTLEIPVTVTSYYKFK